MKKYLTLTMLLCAAFTFCFTGCGKDKKAKNGAPDYGAVAQTENIEQMDSSSYLSEETNETRVDFVEAVSIYSNAGVYVTGLAGDDKLRWVGSLVKGQQVLAEGLGDINEYPMNFVNDKEGAEKTVMARIRIDCENGDTPGNDGVYYVVKANLAYGSRTFVVVGDDLSNDVDYTYMYSEPDLKKITSRKIPTGTLIAVSDYDQPEAEFYHATFYIPDGDYKGLYRDKYVEASAVTNSKAYVDGAMVADRLRNIKKNDTKPEVYWGAIDSLRKYYGSEEISKFYSYIGVMDER